MDVKSAVILSLALIDDELNEMYNANNLKSAYKETSRCGISLQSLLYKV